MLINLLNHLNRVVLKIFELFQFAIGAAVVILSTGLLKLLKQRELCHEKNDGDF